MAWRRAWSVFLALGFQCLLLSLGAAAYEFTVGGRRGWAVPTGNKTETYNQWAERNRFQVGDTLVFKYRQGEDSVLRVSAEDYQGCNTAKPIESYSNGNTVFKFPRSGPFYFISGAAEKCEKGEKVIVVVLAPRNLSRSGGRAVPVPAPAPSISSPPRIAPSPSISAPTPVVASPPSKAPSPSPSPSPSTVSAAPGPSPFIASTPSPGPSTASPVPSPSIISPTPASVTSPAPVPSTASPVPVPSTASPAPASLKAPAPASSNPPSTGTPPPSASSPVVAAPSGAPPSAESTKPSAAASIGFASALPLVMIILSSLLN